MFTKSKNALSAAIILAAASPALARSSALPNIDLQVLCQASQSDAPENLFGSCLKDEQGAREQLLKSWSTVPAVDKARCLQPTTYMPSYVEWLTCVEMAGDVGKMRKEQSASSMSALGKPTSPSAGHHSLNYRTGSRASCPVVQFRQDGSIAGMNAC